LYTLHLDNQLFNIADPKLPVSPFGDRRLRVESLEALSAAARGAMFTITGSGVGVFERIEAELSGYYLLAVQSGPDDRDGRGHPVRVSIRRKGALVRARALINSNPAADRDRSPRQVVATALGSPLPVASLPLRVGAFSLLGPEPGRIQLLFHADVGTGYAAPARVALGYQITDPDGRLVDSQAADLRLRPVMNGGRPRRYHRARVPCGCGVERRGDVQRSHGGRSGRRACLAATDGRALGVVWQRARVR
jgi:hypothetical protein